MGSISILQNRYERRETVLCRGSGIHVGQAAIFRIRRQADHVTARDCSKPTNTF